MDWTNPKTPEASATEETGEKPVQKTPNRKLLKAARNLGVALALPAAAVAADMADPNAAAATHECGVVGGIPVCKPHSSTPTTQPASTPTTRRATTPTTRRASTPTTRRATTATTRAATSSAATPQKPAAQPKTAGGSPNTQPPVDAAAEQARLAAEQARLAAEAQAAAEQARLAAEAQAAEAANRRAAIIRQFEGRDTEQAAIPTTLTEPVAGAEGAGSNTREANPWVPIGLATAVIGIGGIAAVRRSRSQSTVHQDLSGQPEENDVPVLTDQLPQDSSITVAVPANPTVPETSSVLSEV